MANLSTTSSTRSIGTNTLSTRSVGTATSSTRSIGTATSSTRSIAIATSTTITCPFSDPHWKISVLTQKFDHNGGTLRISEHDINIVIPKLAISTGDVAEIQATAVLSGPYKTPSGYDPISVTVWIAASYKFNKLIKVSIPHCAVINGPQDITGLVVLTSSDGEEFTVNKNSRHSSQTIEHTNCYCYKVSNPQCDYYTDHYCGCICLARRSFQPITLSIIIFCWKSHDYESTDKLLVEFCFCYDLKYYVKVCITLKTCYQVAMYVYMDCIMKNT